MERNIDSPEYELGLQGYEECVLDWYNCRLMIYEDARCNYLEYLQDDGESSFFNLEYLNRCNSNLWQSLIMNDFPIYYRPEFKGFYYNWYNDWSDDLISENECSDPIIEIRYEQSYQLLSMRNTRLRLFRDCIANHVEFFNHRGRLIIFQHWQIQALMLYNSYPFVLEPEADELVCHELFS